VYKHVYCFESCNFNPDRCHQIKYKNEKATARKMTILLVHVFFLWGETKSLGTAATSGLLYKPQMIVQGDCGEIGGKKKIGWGN
jgi:hypothetical protein